MPMNPRLLRPTQGGFISPDADARAYLATVRQADKSNLEPAVAKAISDFVIGCKADGIWNAIKASCILAGARTLEGALVPLKGAAPTNNGPFVSGDYNRKTGLGGNGSTKYLDSNRADNADPQNDYHVAFYATTFESVTAYLMGAGQFFAGATTLGFDSGSTFFRMRSSGLHNIAGAAPGLTGASRSSSSAFVARTNGTSTTFSRASQTPSGLNVGVFGSDTAAAVRSSSRIAFYSIGESLDLSLLDTRVSTLMNAIGAAIP